MSTEEVKPVKFDPSKFADLKGPRFNLRKFRSKIVSKEVYKSWKKESNTKLDFTAFKKIWKLIAKEIQEVVITEPDGVQLPHGIGTIHMAYVKLKQGAIDYKTSKQYNTLVRYENYHSYGKVGKIMYFPCGKYKLDVCKLWNFTPITPFKEKGTKAFITTPEIYKNSRQKKNNGNTSNRASNIPA